VNAIHLKGDTQAGSGHLKKVETMVVRDDSQIEVRRISFVFAQEKSKDRQAPQFGNFFKHGKSQSSRTGGAVL
jgi:hypothetical protein